MADSMGYEIAARQRRPFCRERLDVNERPGRRFWAENPTTKSAKGANLPSETVLGNASVRLPRSDILLLNNQVREMKY
jgi:hypothetical protein